MKAAMAETQEKFHVFGVMRRHEGFVPGGKVSKGGFLCLKD